MADIKLINTKLHAGVWEGELHISGLVKSLPNLEITHHDLPVGEYTLDEHPDQEGVWLFRSPLPAELLGDGVHVFVLADRDTGEKLASFTVIAGEVLGDDIRSEMELLRAELDMLKRAFRRHCVETGSN